MAQAAELHDRRAEADVAPGRRRLWAAAPPPRDGATARPVGIVMGDVDLVRTLALAGIPVALFDVKTSTARFSRHVTARIPWSDPGEDPDAVIRSLLAFARRQPSPPVLFPQSDEALRLISRRRGELGDAVRFVAPDADLVEQLVDKGRFQALAERHGLPIPRARRVQPAQDIDPRELGLRFPLVIKPVLRTTGWERLAGGNKAFHAGDVDDLVAVWPRLLQVGSELVAQEVVPGPERNIVSFHAYVDADGEIAGSFTGQKVRTYPTRYGHSTAVEITDLPDVARLGRHVLETLGFRGVVKVDFKRDARGDLRLLEINPRFNLWHLPAAIGGLNLPALVYADLTGAPRPSTRPVPSGMTWCKPLRDVRAAYVVGMKPPEWLRWLRTCDAVSGLSRQDPMPFLAGSLPTTVAHQLRRAAGAAVHRGRRPAG